MDLVKDFIGLLSGDTVSIVLKIVLGVLALGMSVFGFWWIEKKRREQAHEKTEKDRSETQAGIDDQNRRLSDEARRSEDQVEEIIRKRGGS